MTLLPSVYCLKQLFLLILPALICGSCAGGEKKERADLKASKVSGFRHDMPFECPSCQLAAAAASFILHENLQAT